MTSGGFIKLHRKLTEWEWYSDPCTKDVFLHLLLTANHKTRREKGVTYKRGQAVFGRREMALKLGISERNVRTALNHLKSTNEITIKATKRGSVATIVNYEKYQVTDTGSVQQSDQGNDRKVTNNRPTSDQQVTTNKNEKNEKNEKRGGLLTPNPSSWKRDSVQRSRRPSESGGDTRVKEKRRTKKRAGKNFYLNSRIKLMSMGNRLWLKHWTGRSLQGGRDGILKAAFRRA